MNIPYPPLHYYQNQGIVRHTGSVECVTTSVVIAMNMAKDRLTRDLDQPSIPDICVRDYVARLDGMHLFGLRYRFPTDFPVATFRGWMLPVLQAPAALKQFASELRKKYHSSYTVRQTSGNSLDDIRRNLRDGNIVLIHGLWLVTDPKELPYKLGGWPHTMLPVDVDSHPGKVILLNPAIPDPGTINPEDPATYPAPLLDEMSNADFLSFWGRKSTLNLYTRPFTMTVVIPDTSRA